MPPSGSPQDPGVDCMSLCIALAANHKGELVGASERCTRLPGRNGLSRLTEPFFQDACKDSQFTGRLRVQRSPCLRSCLGCHDQQTVQYRECRRRVVYLRKHLLVSFIGCTAGRDCGRFLTIRPALLVFDNGKRRATIYMIELQEVTSGRRAIPSQAEWMECATFAHDSTAEWTSIPAVPPVTQAGGFFRSRRSPKRCRTRAARSIFSRQPVHPT